MQVEGTIPFLGMLELLQVAGFQHRSFRLELEPPGGPGVVILRDGVVLHAEREGATGPEALFALLGACGEGRFRIRPPQAEHPATVRMKTEAILMRAAMALPPAGNQRACDPAWRAEGDLALLGVQEILQIFENNRRPTECFFEADGGATARLLLAEGGIVEARLAEAEGAEAVYRLLDREAGAFRLASPREAPRVERMLDIASVICEGLRRRDEARREGLHEVNQHGREALEAFARGELDEAARLELARRYLPGGETAPAEVLPALAVDESERVRRAALETILDLPEPILEAFAGDGETPPPLLRLLLLQVRAEAVAVAAVANPATPDDALLAYAADPEAHPAAIDAYPARPDVLARSRSLRSLLRQTPACRFRDLLDELDHAAPPAPKMRKLGFGAAAPAEPKPDTLVLEAPEEDPKKEKVGGKVGPKEIQFIARRGTLRQKMQLVCGNEAEVAVEIVSQPGLPDPFIEGVAESTAANGAALAWIAGETKFKRKPAVVKALLTNPKTPSHASIPLLPLVRIDTVEGIATNRNLPDGLRQSARQLVDKRSKKKK